MPALPPGWPPVAVGLFSPVPVAVLPPLVIESPFIIAPPLFIEEDDLLGLTCPRTLIQSRLEPAWLIRRLARVEQRAIGEAGRGCAVDRPLR